MSQISSSITELIDYIGSQGAQDVSRFRVFIKGGVANSAYIDYTPSIIGVKLPGPAIQFIKVNYWAPNPEFYIPYGIKYPDQLILEMLMPENATQNVEHASLMNFFAPYFRGLFQIGNGGAFLGSPSSTSENEQYPFRWLNKVDYAVKIEALTRTNTISRTYEYKKCYIERILPIEFDASKADIQSFSVSFVVSEM